MKLRIAGMLVIAVGLTPVSGSALVLAHPGHEYHVEGTISKVRAAATDLAAGLTAEVDGVENNRGLVEAKKVSLTR